jgi:hypothetical protein
MAVTLNASNSGTGGLSVTSDATGNLAFQTAGTTAVTVDTSQNVGIGTASPTKKLESAINAANETTSALRVTNLNTAGYGIGIEFADELSSGRVAARIASNTPATSATGDLYFQTRTASALTEKMRIDSSGRLLVGKTASNIANAGVEFEGNGYTAVSRTNEIPMTINRLGNDGVLLQFLQATTEEGTISVSGTTVSYNGGHLSRWAQTTTEKDNSLVKGTVLSNLDAMNVYTDAEGNPVENEQLNKVKVSDVEGDANVAGVFVNWTYDEAHQVDEINMAMTGDMIIRIAQGVTVQRGDLLMSAGDGTAKAQSDDIVRSKTIAKVTSNHVTCTYADGSYCVPCVLMAC